jgi:DNA-binding NtrC family response regulator
MNDLSRESIMTELQNCEYGRAKAARRLGISPPTLSKLVKHHGIDLQPSPHFHSHPREYYQAALDECLGQIAATARYLGVSISTIRKHLKRHKLAGYADE